jgi:hypothetical protein
MVALISLVLLCQAAPGLAYTLNGGKGYVDAENNQIPIWIETHGDTLFDDGGIPYTVNIGYPGYMNGDFQGTYTDTATGQYWKIGKGVNTGFGTLGTPSTDEIGNLWVTVTIVYDAGSHDFVAQNYDGPNISSTDTLITTIGNYRANSGTGGPLLENSFTLENQTMTVMGAGTNSDGTPFTFTADMVETYWDHNHYGYLENFDVVYGSADPAAAPIPGAVWLLGSGLLGLAGLRARRKS